MSNPKPRSSIVWPSTLPLPHPDFSAITRQDWIQDPDPIYMGREAGSRTSLNTLSVKWNFSPSEFSTFSSFWEDTLWEGTARFMIPLLYPNALEDWMVRLQEWTGTWEGGRWSVEGTLELLETPIPRDLLLQKAMEETIITQELWTGDSI